MESQTIVTSSKNCKLFDLEITELSTHLQGQPVAVHPAYDLMFDNFAPEHLKGKPKAEQNGR